MATAACSSGTPAARETRLWPGAEWFDDWYAVQRIDASTFAIAEPRYDQHNVNYLLVGSNRALLLDTGPGERDIRAVVAALTPLPVTAAFSHTHFDHVGGHQHFDRIGSIDHPTIRARVDAGGRFTPSLLQYAALGRPTFRITEWWTPNATVDLGGRVVRVLSVPGHTPESLALYDAGRDQLFTGDFMYPGDIFAFNPGSDLAAYRDSARQLLALLEQQPEVAIYGAHVPTSATPPRQGLEDLRRLESALEQLLDGHAWRGALTIVMWIPVRRHDFGNGLTILTSLF